MGYVKVKNGRVVVGWYDTNKSAERIVKALYKLKKGEKKDLVIKIHVNGKLVAVAEKEAWFEPKYYRDAELCNVGDRTIWVDLHLKV